MNNYCTNCGKKLEKGDLKCPKCGTMVVDEKPKFNYKGFFIALGIIALFISTIYLVLYVQEKKVEKKQQLEKEEKENASISVKNEDLHKQSLFAKDYILLKYPNKIITKFNAYYLSECVGGCSDSCDGSCVTGSKIAGCKYYKYNIAFNESDIGIINFTLYQINNNNKYTYFCSYEYNRSSRLVKKYINTKVGNMDDSKFVFNDYDYELFDLQDSLGMTKMNEPALTMRFTSFDKLNDNWNHDYLMKIKDLLDYIKANVIVNDYYFYIRFDDGYVMTFNNGQVLVSNYTNEVPIDFENIPNSLNEMVGSKNG